MSDTQVRQMISAEEIDRRFDNGEDVLEYFDIANARVIKPSDHSLKKLSVSVPEWIVERLDSRARHLGISRNAALNVLLASVLE